MSMQRLLARVPDAKAIGVARLAGYRLAFHKIGSDGSGKCDIPESQDSAVFGRVYKIKVADFALLDRFEGVGSGYRRDRIEVFFNDDQVSMYSYFATKTDANMIPFSWYRHHVLEGALSTGLPSQYISQIREVESVRDHDLERERREMEIYL